MRQPTAPQPLTVPLSASIGPFDPGGHVLLGIPPAADRSRLIDALRGAGIGAAALAGLPPCASVRGVQAMFGDERAERFGFDLALMRRFIEMSRLGFRWLLVSVADSEAAQRVAAVARMQGAPPPARA